MKILGLKLTHDGAIALIDNGRLIFSHEIEKIGNQRRYSQFNLNIVGMREIISSFGYKFEDLDQIVIDGWGYDDNNNPKKYEIEIEWGNGKAKVGFADYGLLVTNENMLKEERFELQGYGIQYTSYTHISGHILAAYCTSPFAREGKSSYILVWDAPVTPQLFYFNSKSNSVENLGPLFPLQGLGYYRFAMNYEPFSNYDNPIDTYNLSVSGKVMAYIALGKVQENVLAKFHEIYREYLDAMGNKFKTSADITVFTGIVLAKLVEYGKSVNCKPEDMMTIYHQFIQDLLVENLKQTINKYPDYERNLCNAGGCALNIKWNRAIRESDFIDDMWVIPFPNDSGSAIGTACCEMVNRYGKSALDWNVYQGPPLVEKELDNGEWTKQPCSVKELAAFLHRTSEPVVFLKQNAELGPRALGNRSILAPAVDYSMKDRLNKIKKREYYRPVAPICLEEDAPNVFSPGTPDPYMLFDHMVKKDWEEKIPAVCHLDGTARLQTINKDQNHQVYDLLSEYKKLSGIPLLCNTSANYKGRGFFPDVKSAQEWGEVDFVWSNDILYSRNNADKKK